MPVGAKLQNIFLILHLLIFANYVTKIKTTNV
jgi:hypothetical protein